MRLKEYVWACINVGYLPEPRRHRKLGKLLDETLVRETVRGIVAEYWTVKQTKVVVTSTDKVGYIKPTKSGYTFDECTIAADGTPGVVYVIDGLLPSEKEVEELVQLLNQKEERK